MKLDDIPFVRSLLVAWGGISVYRGDHVQFSIALGALVLAQVIAWAAPSPANAQGDRKLKVVKGGGGGG